MNGLSIVIPVYNAKKYLMTCFESLRKVKYLQEVIIVDDGSTDGSSKICDEYTEIDYRFKVIHKKNQGLVLARKTGICEVKSAYLTFVDADDYIDADELNCILAELFENIDYENVDIVCTGMTEEYLGKNNIKINKFNEGIYSANRLYDLYGHMLSYGAFFEFGMLPNVCGKIFRTQFVQNNPVNINPLVTVGEDADMTYQCLLKADKIAVINRAPYHYCRHVDSMMFRKTPDEAIDALENDLYKAFSDSQYDKVQLLNQLKDYIDFIYLICNPRKLLEKDDFFDTNKKRMALYGAGGVGKAVWSEMEEFFSIWVDKNASFYSDNRIDDVDKLIEKKNEYDKIYIAVSNVSICKEICKSIRNMGIDKPIYYYRCKEDNCLL